MRYLHARPRLVISALIVLALTACAKRYIAGTTPQQAMAYELNEGLTHLRSAQKAVIAAVDARPSLKPQADKFLNPVRDAFVLARDRVIPALEAYDAADKIGDEIKKAALSGDIKPLLIEFNKLTAQAFGASLPEDVSTSIAGFVAQVQKTLSILRNVFKVPEPAPVPVA